MLMYMRLPLDSDQVRLRTFTHTISITLLLEDDWDIGYIENNLERFAYV